MPRSAISLIGDPEKIDAGFLVFIDGTIMVLTEGADEIEDLSLKDEMGM